MVIVSHNCRNIVYNKSRRLSRQCSYGDNINLTIRQILILYSTKHLRGKILQILWFLLEPQMFSHKFQSVLALVDAVLVQTWKFFCKYPHSDLTMKVLSLGSFVLYGNTIMYLYIIFYCVISLQFLLQHWHNWWLLMVLLTLLCIYWVLHTI